MDAIAMATQLKRRNGGWPSLPGDLKSGAEIFRNYRIGTLGGAGHAAAMLAASSPTGWLYGCDRDGDAVEAAQRRLAEFAGRFEIRRGNFSELSDWDARWGWTRGSHVGREFADWMVVWMRSRWRRS